MTTDPQTDPNARKRKRRGLIIPVSTGAVLLLFLVAFGVTIIEEGHVGIVKRWGKAVAQLDPGFHFIVPVADSIEKIEVRQRKNVEELRAATENQLPITASVSINWTVNRESAMDLFIAYGGLDQFEARILDPKLRSAAKAALSKFRYPATLLTQVHSHTFEKREPLGKGLGTAVTLSRRMKASSAKPPHHGVHQIPGLRLHVCLVPWIRRVQSSRLANPPKGQIGFFDGPLEAAPAYPSRQDHGHDPGHIAA